jgi:hypothetical protein
LPSGFPGDHPPQTFHTTSGSLAMLAAIRRDSVGDKRNAEGDISAIKLKKTEWGHFNETVTTTSSLDFAYLLLAFIGSR